MLQDRSCQAARSRGGRGTLIAPVRAPGSCSDRHGEEVEAVHGLDDRELRLADAAFRGPAFAIQQLQFRDAQQVVLIVHLLDGALPCHLVVLAQDGGQAQFLQVMLQQQLRRVGGGPGIVSIRWQHSEEPNGTDFFACEVVDTANDPSENLGSFRRAASLK